LIHPDVEMEIRCPACRKVNESPEPRTCGRCECDLSELFRITRAAQDQNVRSADCLRRGMGRRAYGHALRSWSLKRTLQGAQLAFLAACQMGETIKMKAWARIILRLRAG